MMRQYRLLEQPDVSSDRIYTGEVARLHSLSNQRPPFDAKNPYLAPMKVNRELHKAGDRSCMHVEFDLEGSKMRYEAGDHLAVYPVNDSDLVERLGKLCNSNLDTVFSLINTDTDSSKKNPFPCPTTYRAALTHYLEITALPRTHIIKELMEYCAEEKDKEFLKLMSSTTAEGKAKYQSWVQDACCNIVHILEDIPSCRPPIDHICELLPRLQPRYYSISSSSKVSECEFH
jgi:NADPH-ferrihemoprotein reductase